MELCARGVKQYPDHVALQKLHADLLADCPADPASKATLVQVLPERPSSVLI
jgi:hypothetical protein